MIVDLRIELIFFSMGSDSRNVSFEKDPIEILTENELLFQIREEIFVGSSYNQEIIKAIFPFYYYRTPIIFLVSGGVVSSNKVLP